jgi:hypothetical protein
MGRHVSSTGEVKNACKNVVRKLEGKGLLEDLNMGGKIIF